MTNVLVIIEAPGKRASLSDVLWRVGLRGAQVLATVGHIASNPASLSPLGVTSGFRETSYALREDRQHAVERIRAAAQGSDTIYLATDDDQEGDVIARDVYFLALEPEDRQRVQRVRLRSLAASEVRDAFALASPFDPLAAAKGDARRILDRMIGALSSAEGAVGRVQGSLLLALSEQKPVLGVMTHRVKSEDGEGDWIAQQPVYVDSQLFDASVDVSMGVGSSVAATLGARPMAYGEIVLSASLETGASARDVSKAMQSLYERGQLTYPRSQVQALSMESARRLQVMARMNGAAFDQRRFTSVRRGDLEAEHGHEAPNCATVDVPLNRDNALLALDERVLVHIARQHVDCGVGCNLQRPRLADLERLPQELAGLDWHRRTDVGLRLYESEAPVAGLRRWTPEQSLLHLMQKNRLGRPSTLVEHVEKFVRRGLVDDELELTAKGRDWCANVGRLFHHQNLARLTEEYLDANREAAPLMVADMVNKFGLSFSEGDGMLFNQEHESEREATGTPL